ncbi:MAG: nuclear transport factor 2 family protein [Actinobacteria bacterium]|nr:nuclear transport factor 2 family protein [Actinomycetota bacterium]
MRPSESISARMLEIYERWIGYDEGGFGTFWSHSDNILSVGTDPAEWWESRSRIVGTWNAQAAMLKAREFESRALRAYADRSFGWAADDVLVRFESGEVAQFRFTAVFRLEHGRWMLVSWHASHTVENVPGVPVGVDELAEAVTARPPDLHPAMAPDGTVAVMFSDIESSTSLANALGDAEWMEVLRWHNDRVRGAVDAWRGYEVKAQGDGFMLAFASPVDQPRPPRNRAISSEGRARKHAQGTLRCIHESTVRTCAPTHRVSSADRLRGHARAFLGQ